MPWVVSSFDTDQLTNLADRMASNSEFDTNHPDQEWRLS